MTQWIELTRKRQNGEPITRSIKIAGIDREVWFTTKGYAEVKDNVADLLSSQNDFINEVSAPSDPGTYYEEANANQSITITLPDGAFNHLSADSIDVDSGLDLADVDGSNLIL